MFTLIIANIITPIINAVMHESLYICYNLMGISSMIVLDLIVICGIVAYIALDKIEMYDEEAKRGIYF